MALKTHNHIHHIWTWPLVKRSSMVPDCFFLYSFKITSIYFSPSWIDLKCLHAGFCWSTNLLSAGSFPVFKSFPPDKGRAEKPPRIPQKCSQCSNIFSGYTYTSLRWRWWTPWSWWPWCTCSYSFVKHNFHKTSIHETQPRTWNAWEKRRVSTQAGQFWRISSVYTLKK